jgi:hypothetical protein
LAFDLLAFRSFGFSIFWRSIFWRFDLLAFRSFGVRSSGVRSFGCRSFGVRSIVPDPLATIALVSLIFAERKERSFESNFNIMSTNKFLDNQLREIESGIARNLKTEETHSIFFFLQKHLEVISEALINSVKNTIESVPYFARKRFEQCVK